MRLADFSWAFGKVLGDWKKRQPKQVRDCLPPGYTASKLRFIRIHACRDAAPKTIQCAKWSQTDPCPPDPSIPTYPLFMEEERKGPFLVTAEHVCDDCKHPCVTNGEFISKLGLDADNPNFSDRTLRRYMNAEEPMPTDLFRRAIANALANDWMGLWQVVTVWTHIEQMEASRRGLWAVFKRARERKAYRERGELDITEEDVEKELAKQMRLLDNETTRAIHQRLKDKNLPPDLRQFMEEALFEKKK